MSLKYINYLFKFNISLSTSHTRSSLLKKKQASYDTIKLSILSSRLLMC